MLLQIPAFATILLSSVTLLTAMPMQDSERIYNIQLRCSKRIVDLIRCVAGEGTLFAKFTRCESAVIAAVTCFDANSNIDDVISGLMRETDTDDGEETVEYSAGDVGKRGLGRCIHKCLRGEGRMNFIQCKSMCH